MQTPAELELPWLQVAGPVLGLALLTGMLVLAGVGRRYGAKVLAANPEGVAGTGAVEATVFSLLGLLIAFTFSGAFSRLDYRRNLVVDEVNAVGTAFMRLDLIDDAQQRGELRELLKSYVESRMRLWDRMDKRETALQELTAANVLRGQIWSSAIAATAGESNSAARRSLLPALNDMFDLSTARVIAVQTHPPALIYVALFGLALIAAFLVGFSMAKSPRVQWLHVVAFAAVIAAMLCLILDIDYPRFGLVTLDSVHSLYSELQESMGQRIAGDN